MDWIINLFRGFLNLVMLLFCALGILVLFVAFGDAVGPGEKIMAMLVAVGLVVFGAAVAGIGATLVGIYDRLGDLVARTPRPERPIAPATARPEDGVSDLVRAQIG